MLAALRTPFYEAEVHKQRPSPLSTLPKSHNVITTIPPHNPFNGAPYLLHNTTSIQHFTLVFIPNYATWVMPPPRALTAILSYERSLRRVTLKFPTSFALL